MTQIAKILALSMLLWGCVSSLARVDDFEDCRELTECEVRGLAVAKAGEHGRDVEVRATSGECVNLSVPDELWEKLRITSDRFVQAKGKVVIIPRNENGEDMVVEIDGRRIGYGRCGDYIIFVEHVWDMDEVN